MSMDEYSRSFIGDDAKAKLGELVAQYRMLGVDITGSGALEAQSSEKSSESDDSDEDDTDKIVNALTEDTEKGE